MFKNCGKKIVESFNRVYNVLWDLNKKLKLMIDSPWYAIYSNMPRQTKFLYVRSVDATLVFFLILRAKYLSWIWEVLEIQTHDLCSCLVTWTKFWTWKEISGVVTKFLLGKYTNLDRDWHKSWLRLIWGRQKFWQLDLRWDLLSFEREWWPLCSRLRVCKR